MIYISILEFGVLLGLMNIIGPFKRFGTASLALSPVVWFTVFFVIIHLLVPAMKFQLDMYRYQPGYEQHSLSFMALLTLITYQLAVVVATKLSYRPIMQILNKKGNEEIWGSGRRDRVGRIMLIGCLTLLIGVYGAYNNWAVIDENYLSDRISAGVGRGFQTQLPNFLISASLIFLYISLSHSKSAVRYKFAAIIFGISAIIVLYSYYSSINSRNSIFFAGLAILTCFSILRPTRIKMSKAFVRRFILSSIVVFMLINFTLEMTKTRYTNNLVGGPNDRIDNLFYHAIDGAFGNDENLVWLAEHDFERQLGITYIAAFTNFVPRSIWPEKPLGAGPRIKNIIYPGSYLVGQKGNSSITTGLFTEAYLNFGILGLLIIPIVWALLSAKLSIKTARSIGSIWVVTWATAVVLWGVMAMYGEFLGFIGRSTFVMAPLVMASLIGTRRHPLRAVKSKERASSPRRLRGNAGNPTYRMR